MSKTLKGNNPNYRLSFSGNVQGVGFRPLVYRIAKKLGLSGWVINTGKGAAIEVSGSAKEAEELLKEIKSNLPHHAHIRKISVKPVKGISHQDFSILSSRKNRRASADIPPDLSICPNCLREVLDRSDRRYHYPFTNCTDCGPRFTITKKVPYDRNNTTMAEFRMCSDCFLEYTQVSDRRFHAQPNACPVCGPKIKLLSNKFKYIAKEEEALVKTIKLLEAGKIIAIKGLGGYHIACDALNPKTVNILRKRKNRSHKPFAVMVKDLKTVQKFAYINDEERELLISPERPIILLRKKKTVPENISPANAYIGIMLPYSPLHYLLFSRNSLKMLIMTSGNRADEPICSTESEAKAKLSGITDHFLIHNRKIHNRCDDSIMFNFNKKNTGNIFIRRSRGFVPKGINIGAMRRQPCVLGTGAEMKNTFCLTRNGDAHVSQYIGDMDNADSLSFYKEALERFEKYLDVRPAVVAHDLHPDYMTTAFSRELKSKHKKLSFVPVQHHEAHIAAVAAENKLKKPLLGFAFDGTGLGYDGRIWGGECFLLKGKEFIRLAHFDNLQIPGGDIATKEIWRLGLSLLIKNGIDCPGHYRRYPSSKIKKMMGSKINSPDCSSVGRIFDAVSSILDLRQTVSFEAQAAMELESMALDTTVKKGYNFNIFYDEKNKCSVVSLAQTIKEILADKKSKVKTGIISARFHKTISDIIVALARKYKAIYCTSDIALSGGVFQNRVLLSLAVKGLKSSGFNVYLNKAVPPNDGCISLGQAYLATKRQRLCV